MNQCPFKFDKCFDTSITIAPLTQVEQIIGEKHIEHVGFDMKSSLTFLDEDKINEIENHVNENKFLSTGTVYENIVTQFKFQV